VTGRIASQLRLAALFALVCALAACGESPAEGYAKITALAAKGDWAGVYDRVDKRSQGRLEASLRRFASSPDEPPREVFARAARVEDHLAARFPTDYQVTATDAQDDEATLRLSVKRKDGEAGVETKHLVREDGIWKVTLEAVEPPAAAPAEDPAERRRAIECGRLLDVFNRGRDTIKSKQRGGDPIETLGAMAKTLDASAVEAAQLELGTPELAAFSSQYQGMAKDVAQAARDMASASRGHDQERADAAARAYEAAASREKPILDGVRRACGR
jgi:hypothetical protein